MLVVVGSCWLGVVVVASDFFVTENALRGRPFVTMNSFRLGAQKMFRSGFFSSSH